MTSQKAIEILTLMGTPQYEGTTEDILLARKIGTEAIQRLNCMRSYNVEMAKPSLPHEERFGRNGTKDQA